MSSGLAPKDAQTPLICIVCGHVVTEQQELIRQSGPFCSKVCKALHEVFISRYGTPPIDPAREGLFKICKESGLLSDSGGPPSGESHTGPSSYELLDVEVGISGMTCPSCAWIIEEVLRRQPGIHTVKVDFLTDSAIIKYDATKIDPQALISKLSAMGYEGSLSVPGWDYHREMRTELLRFGIAAVLSAHVMMMSWALYGGFFMEVGEEFIHYLSFPLWILSTPVVFLCGWKILKRGFWGVKTLRPNMDTLIALGSLSSYFYSLIQVFAGSLHVYFDTSSMLITTVLAGRLAEQALKSKGMKRGLGALSKLKGLKARLVGGEREVWIPADGVEEGQLLKVAEGEWVPVDGEVVEGEGALDRSILTGESKPVTVVRGKLVEAGAFLIQGQIIVRAFGPGQESLIGSMAQMVVEALKRPTKWEGLADRVTRWFVPLVVFLGLGVMIWDLSINVPFEGAMLKALAVWVVACPCALGIATPLAKVAALYLGARCGIWIREPKILETAGRLHSIILDKTGTLTEGDFKLRGVFCSPGDETTLVTIAASLETRSRHHLAKTLVKWAQEKGLALRDPISFFEKDGLGIKGRIGELEVAVGSRAWMCETGHAMEPEVDDWASSMECEGMTVVFVGWESEVKGALAFGDCIKQGARETIDSLKAKGLEIWMVSGDSHKTTAWVAKQLGIERFLAEALPYEKTSLVRGLLQQGKKVGMAGDGLNDAPSLAMVDLGMAVGTRLHGPQEAAAVYIARPDPRAIVAALDLCRVANKTVIQNLVFSAIYNLIALGVALFGGLTPLHAVGAMFASSLTVVGNSWRLSKKDLF